MLHVAQPVVGQIAPLATIGNSRHNIRQYK